MLSRIVRREQVVWRLVVRAIVSVSSLSFFFVFLTVSAEGSSANSVPT